MPPWKAEKDPSVVRILRPGATVLICNMVVTPEFCSWTPDAAVTAIGTDCRFSARFCAVTTMSCKLLSAVCDGAAAGDVQARPGAAHTTVSDSVVVGASNIVGKPMALMLMNRAATVAVCHAKTRELAQFTILTDILVVAAGVPNLIVPQMVKTGVIVIDVGIKQATGRINRRRRRFRRNVEEGFSHNAGAWRRGAADSDGAT